MVESPEEWELSALLDGELDPRRRDQLRALISQDPQLRQRYQHLADADGRWRAAASSAHFTPRIDLHPPVAMPPRAHLGLLAPVTLLLLVARMGGKMGSLALPTSVLFQTLLLLVIVGVVVAISRRSAGALPAARAEVPGA